MACTKATYLWIGILISLLTATVRWLCATLQPERREQPTRCRLLGHAHIAAAAAVAPLPKRLALNRSRCYPPSAAGGNGASSTPAPCQWPSCLPLAVLCIDSGGARGLQSVRVLQQLDSLLAPLRVSKLCNVFGGTSVGATISLYLLLGLDLKSLATLLTTPGNLVARTHHRWDPRAVLHPRYCMQNDRLPPEAHSDLYQLKKEQSPLLRYFAAPVVCMEVQEVSLISTLPEGGGERKRAAALVHDRTTLGDIVRALCSVPTYFDPVSVRRPDGAEQHLLDAAFEIPNPSWCVHDELCNGGVAHKNIHILSVGTGQPTAADVAMHLRYDDVGVIAAIRDIPVHLLATNRLHEQWASRTLDRDHYARLQWFISLKHYEASLQLDDVQSADESPCLAPETLDNAVSMLLRVWYNQLSWLLHICGAASLSSLCL